MNLSVAERELFLSEENIDLGSSSRFQHSEATDITVDDVLKLNSPTKLSDGPLSDVTTEYFLNPAQENYPALEKTLRMVESARNKINTKLSRYGLPPVELPTFVSVEKYYPQRRKIRLPDGVEYVLPDGLTEAAYDRKDDNVIFNELCILGTDENKELLNIYRNAFNTVNSMIGKYPDLSRPLKRLRTFYAMIIDNIQKSKEPVAVHELTHKYCEDHGLNDAIGSVPVIEGLTTNVADEIVEKETTMENTKYRDYNRRTRKAFDYLRVYTALGSIKRYFEEGFPFGKRLRQAYATAAAMTN